jgi:hypothetical protein
MIITPPPAVSRHTLRQAFSAACRLTGPLQVSAVHRRTGQEQTFVVRRPYATVGRGSACDVRLNDPSVSRWHAFLQAVEGRVYCADLGSRTGVVWEDGRNGPGWLGGDRAARVGVFDLRVIGPDEPANRPPSPPPAAALDVYRGSDTPVGTCPLDWPVTLVGRHPACRLRFVDSTIEYFQGCVVNTADGVWWVDLTPRRTSLVNGQRTRLARLRNTDLVEIGRVTLVARTAEPAGPADGAVVRLTATTAMVPTPDGVGAGVPAAAVTAMMAEVRKCVMAMAESFAALQEEHAAVVGEHLAQIQELTRELRHLRGGGVSVTPVPAKPAPALPPRAAPTARVSAAPDVAALADAHAWFLGQLATAPPPPTATKRRAPSG